MISNPCAVIKVLGSSVRYRHMHNLYSTKAEGKKLPDLSQQYKPSLQTSQPFPVSHVQTKGDASS